MAQIKAKDLREKTDQELLDQIQQEKKRIFDATVRGASGEAIKPHEKRGGKRLIARIQTILRERALRRGLTAAVDALNARLPQGDAVAAKVAGREPRPHLGRVRARKLARSGMAVTPAVRQAVEVAEMKRRLAALKREDAGEKK